MLWDNEASDVWLSQIEEPVQVLDETASNDVTDYADWSTFDCKPYSVSFSVLFEVFSFVIKVANIRSDQLSLFFFVCVFLQHKNKATCTPAILTPAAHHLITSHLHNRETLEVLIRMGIQTCRSTLWSTLLLAPPVTLSQYTQVQCSESPPNLLPLSAETFHPFLPNKDKLFISILINTKMHSGYET